MDELEKKFEKICRMTKQLKETQQLDAEAEKELCDKLQRLINITRESLPSIVRHETSNGILIFDRPLLKLDSMTCNGIRTSLYIDITGRLFEFNSLTQECKPVTIASAINKRYNILKCTDSIIKAQNKAIPKVSAEYESKRDEADNADKKIESMSNRVKLLAESSTNRSR